MCYRGLRYNYVLIDVVPLWWAQPSGWLNVRLNPDHTVQIVMQMPLDTLLMKLTGFCSNVVQNWLLCVPVCVS